MARSGILYLFVWCKGSPFFLFSEKKEVFAFVSMKRVMSYLHRNSLSLSWFSWFLPCYGANWKNSWTVVLGSSLPQTGYHGVTFFYQFVCDGSGGCKIISFYGFPFPCFLRKDDTFILLSGVLNGNANGRRERKGPQPSKEKSRWSCRVGRREKRGKRILTGMRRGSSVCRATTPGFLALGERERRGQEVSAVTVRHDPWKRCLRRNLKIFCRIWI